MVEILEATSPKEEVIPLAFLNRIFGSQEKKDFGDFSSLETDLHSHLIPGIDDGSQTLESSLEMIRGLKKLGFKKFITTPHVMSDAFRNTPEIIHSGLEKLREFLKVEEPDVVIDAAAEYYVDEIFEENLDNEIPLLTFGGKKKYLLFETSYMNKPLSLESVIFKLNTQGYTPVMAHPERYTYFWSDKDLEKLTELYELGIKFQVNIGSLAGSYSKRAGKIAMQLIEADLVDFLGSDLHSPRQLESIHRSLESSPELRDLIASKRLLNSGLMK